MEGVHGYLAGRADRAEHLFVIIPDHHPGAEPANYFASSASGIGWAIPSGGAWLTGHVSLGLALIVGGLALIILAARSRSRVAIGTAVLAAAAIIGAALNGASFVDFNQDYSSMIMAALFAVALGSYVVGLTIPSTNMRPKRH